MPEVISNYHGFDYQKQFWEAEDRRYEDACDRIALRKLLPKSGEKIVDVCGGYGRLAPEYLHRFKQCYLFDYAQNLLDKAKINHSELIINKGSAYELPYGDSEFDCAMFIRASHHFENIEKIVAGLARIVKSNGKIVIEIANKRHILQIIKYFLRKSPFNPFDLATISRNQKGFFNYHPAYIESIFQQNGLKIRRVLAVSNFRIKLLKKIVGWRLLIFMETVVQSLFGMLKLAPSIYYLLEKQDAQKK